MSPTTAENDPLLHRVIAGNFRIEKLLGSGAMGNVYKAEQLSLGKAVAVKVLHAHLMGDEKLVLRFKREAKSASLLNHPNSIQIIDSGQDKDGTFYIAMELLAGRDLAHVIRDDFPLSLPRIVRIMTQVLSALDEAHAQGVIHRDLKPSNIMLIERRGETDFVKVCDFGIAKAAQNEKDDRENMLTIQGLVCGTPEYMAPEQARGEQLDGRADLYAAAVILFQMVTGDIPFKGDTPMAIVSRHLVEAPATPSRRRSDVPIPPALDALILKGMEKSREMRFPTALAFREALEEIAPADAGRSSSTSHQRAQMPTAQISGAGATAVVPSSDPANHFGVTTQMPRRSKRTPLAFGFGLVLAGAAVLVLRTQNIARDPSLPTEASVVNPIAPAAPPPPVAPAPPLPRPRPSPPPNRRLRPPPRAGRQRTGAGAARRRSRRRPAPGGRRDPRPGGGQTSDAQTAQEQRPPGARRDRQRAVGVARRRRAGRTRCRRGAAGAAARGPGRARPARRARGADRGRKTAGTGRSARRLRARRGGQAPEPEARGRLQVPGEVLHARRKRQPSQ